MVEELHEVSFIFVAAEKFFFIVGSVVYVVEAVFFESGVVFWGDGHGVLFLY